ncbi:hypothetical protein SUGI_0731970 [Cryptomeria japonica]|nr:hypothetical protein SUGI_0731970 [Cryptomeria japonica]
MIRCKLYLMAVYDGGYLSNKDLRIFLKLFFNDFSKLTVGMTDIQGDLQLSKGLEVVAEFFTIHYLFMIEGKCKRIHERLGDHRRKHACKQPQKEVSRRESTHSGDMAMGVNTPSDIPPAIVAVVASTPEALLGDQMS